MPSLTITDIRLVPRGSVGGGPTDMGALAVPTGARFIDADGRRFDGPATVSLWLWDSGRYVGQVETHDGADPVRIAGEYPGAAA